MRKLDPVRHEEKRLEILEAAGSCFAKKGFQGASIADICSAAQISPGHLYHYFPSKEDIIAAMAEVRLTAATEAMVRVLAGTDPVRAFLSEMARAIARADQGVGPLSLDMLAEARRNPAVAKILHEHTRSVRRLVANVLREGQGRHEVDADLDVEVAAALLVGMATSAKSLPVCDPKISSKKMQHMLETLFWRFVSPNRR